MPVPPAAPVTLPPGPHPPTGAAPPLVEAEGDPRSGPQYRAALELEVWKEEREREFLAEVGRLGAGTRCVCVCHLRCTSSSCKPARPLS